VLVQALAGNVTVQADVLSTSGAISLRAGSAIGFDAGADLRTGGAGTVDVDAGGNLTQSADSVLSAQANIRVAAGQQLTLGRIVTDADVAAIAGGSLVDGGNGAQATVQARALLLSAGQAIGSAARAIDTQVQRLAATAGDGGLFVQERDALAVGAVGVTVSRVAAGGTATALGAATADGLQATGRGAVVLGNGSGDLTLEAGSAGARSAQGVMRLQAAGELALLSGVHSDAGAVSLLAGGDLRTGAGVTLATGGSGTLDLRASAGGIAMGAGSLLQAAADVRVQAQGDLRIARIQTAGQVALLSEQGAVRDNGDAGVHVQAAGLALQAQSVGRADDVFAIQVGTLSARAGAGGLHLDEADGLTVGEVGVSVRRVDAAGATTVLGLAQSDLRTSAGGDVVLTAHGDVQLTDGQSSAGDGAIAAVGGGAVRILASGGGIAGAAGGDIVAATGAITLQASGDIDAAALTASAGILLQSDAGELRVTRSVAGGGGNVTLAADRMDLSATIASAGGVLAIHGASAGHAIAIGDAGLHTTQPDALYLGVDDLSFLVPGFSRIVIGSDAAGQRVQISGRDEAVHLADALVLQTTGNGGQTLLQGAISAASLAVQGSGSGTTAKDASILAQGGIDVDDLLVVAGEVHLESGVGGAGGIVLHRAVDGQGGAADSLILAASGGSVSVTGPVGQSTPLDVLRVSDAADVVFERSVHVSGELVVEATGSVAFKEAVTLDGGTLRIVGAASVALADVDVGTGGDLLIAADSLRFDGIVHGAGDATATLTTATAGGGIRVDSAGSTAGAAGGLLISGETLEALQGFARVDLGQSAAAGEVPASGDALLALETLSLLTTGELNVHGRDVSLRGAGALDITGVFQVDATGAIRMEAATALVLHGAGAAFAAGGDVVLGRVDAGTGVVAVSSSRGTVRAAAAGGAVNVVAGDFVMRGRGPLMQGGQPTLPALVVQASRIDVDAPDGLVVRDSDGSVSAFNLLAGGQSYRQLLAVGQPTRTTSPMDPAEAGPLNAAFALQLDTPLRQAFSASSLAAVSLSPTLSLAPADADSATQAYLDALAGGSVAVAVAQLDAGDAAGALGTALAQSHVLGTAAVQPDAAGTATVQAQSFDFWEDEVLAL
uniref:beta strand repeat-containing protein n=1 Tax=uncultured Pseudacidovorax sp. TaxID=679313 RepID=UPI0025FF649F